MTIAHGRFAAPFAVVVGRVAVAPDVLAPADTVLICRSGQMPECDLAAFAAVLVENGQDYTSSGGRVGVYDNLQHLDAGDVVQIDGRNGRTRTLYRSGSSDNALFVTDRCNNNCMMCSQPPRNDVLDRMEVCFRVVDLVKASPPSRLGITGGEPTLLGKSLVQLLTVLRDDLPETSITTLSNGRGFSDPALAGAIGRIGHPRLRFSVPLHADVPEVHDHVAQAQGAFYEAINGLYNLAASKLDAEIRVVLHRLSVPRLMSLAEYISRKLPFVRQVAFMGMENMGYVKKNWGQLCIDPVDYGGQLQDAVEHLWRRGVDVSVYNLPFCVLPQAIWGFARMSISDHKKILIDVCQSCDVAARCSGLFLSSEERHSRGISPIALNSVDINRTTIS